MVLMFKTISLLFLILFNNTHARTQVPHGHVAKYIVANVTCWFDTYPSGTSLACAYGSAYVTASVTDSFASVYGIRKIMYCPNLTANSSYVTNESVTSGLTTYSITTTTSPSYNGIAHVVGVKHGVYINGGVIRLKYTDGSLNTFFVSDACTVLN